LAKTSGGDGAIIKAFYLRLAPAAAIQLPRRFSCRERAEKDAYQWHRGFRFYSALAASLKLRHYALLSIAGGAGRHLHRGAAATLRMRKPSRRFCAPAWWRGWKEPSYALPGLCDTFTDGAFAYCLRMRGAALGLAAAAWLLASTAGSLPPALSFPLAASLWRRAARRCLLLLAAVRFACNAFGGLS